MSTERSRNSIGTNVSFTLHLRLTRPVALRSSDSQNSTASLRLDPVLFQALADMKEASEVVRPASLPFVLPKIRSHVQPVLNFKLFQYKNLKIRFLSAVLFDFLLFLIYICNLYKARNTIYLQLHTAAPPLSPRHFTVKQ